MKTVLISEFKAKCIQMLKDVKKTKRPIVVTLRGEPMVRVEPIAPSDKCVLGGLKGWIEIKGDIIRSDLDKDFIEQ